MAFESCLAWGWNNLLESFYTRFCAGTETAYEPARVVSDAHGIYGVHCPRLNQDFIARVSGKFKHEARSREEFPSVGDWVCLRAPKDVGEQRIDHLLPRRSCLKRLGAGTKAEIQVMASQIDEVWVVTSLNDDWSIERIERAIVLVRDSGARVRIVLTKNDLVDSETRATMLTPLEARVAGVPIHAVSAVSGDGMQNLRECLKPGETIVIIGSSGVGKSTLINFLMGREVAQVQELRIEDSKGRHTTTSRNLHRIPGGAMLIDTPGTRELQVFSDPAALDEAFSDVIEIIRRCHFGDCSHRGEKGCAVAASLENGTLSEKRWENYQKLAREMAFQERRKDKGLQSQEKKRWAKLSAHATQKSRMKRRS